MACPLADEGIFILNIFVVVVSQPGNPHQSLYAVLQLDENTKGRNTGDDSREGFTHELGHVFDFLQLHGLPLGLRSDPFPIGCVSGNLTQQRFELFPALGRNISLSCPELLHKQPMNDEVRVEIPKDPTHGDYATGFAMQAARPLRMAPRAIGQAIADYILLLSPERIVLGGGVTHQDCLLDLVRQEAVKQLAGYIRAEALSHPETYIVGVSLNDNQGVMGAVKLAMDAEKETEK